MTVRTWRIACAMSSRMFRASVLFWALPFLLPQAALAQFTQDGKPLVGMLGKGAPYQGWSVAMSADGETAIVGGPSDNELFGAAWVYTLGSNGVWTQEGGKLVGTGAVSPPYFGYSVALSADGDTAIVGGTEDTNNGGQGAAWVFTRSGGVWTQQGSKLFGTGAVGSAEQGYSVALSADGDTAIVGGPFDNRLGPSYAGAAWVFTRSGGVWTQQGHKLVGKGAVAPYGASQGWSVALSADGDTAIVGGPADNKYVGASWVFTRGGGVWTQQGAKLVGTGAVGNAAQGASVSLSADGDTALAGGPSDKDFAGAAWVFTRGGAVWTQQGAKLVGTGAVGQANQGYSVVLSADGRSAMEGGRLDNDDTDAGAAWAFTRSGGVWKQQGAKLVGSGDVFEDAQQGHSVALSGDGDTAFVGGPYHYVGNNAGAGAAWVFVQPLEVAPYAGAAASGTLGGPFLPSSFSYTLSATSGNVNYTITGAPSWLTASSTSGTVTTSGKTLNFKINASANKLAPGTYAGAIAFNNADGKQKTISRAVTLTVKAK